LLIHTQKIQTWYGNHRSVPLEEEVPLVRVGTVWNHRLVVQHLYKKEIAEIMAKTGLTPKDPEWIKQFQLAVNAVIKTLGGDAKVSEQYADTAKSWNEIEPPEEIKRK
jgi:ABC-type sulfate transport system substrate-binding protein